MYLVKVLVLANNAGGLYGFRGELLQALLKSGFQVFFCVPEGHEDLAVQKLTSLGCRHIRTQMNRRGVNPLEDLRLVKRYEHAVREVAPDVILSYTIKPNIYGSYAARRYRVPIILNVTGIGSSLSDGRLKLVVRPLYKFACKNATLVFFQNSANLRYFLDSRMVEPSKAFLIPGSGVNLERFKPLKKRQNDGVVKFLFISRIMREKGIDEYLAAAGQIRRKYPNTEFQILGPFEEQRYRQFIEGNPDVRYLGVSDDVRDQIREVDCVVHPSFYNEGMSNVLLEGAAMGKPLLASSIPGCREVVDDGVNGFIVEPRSVGSLVIAIESFLNLGEQERARMGEASRRKVEREFDRNFVVSAYLDAINGIVGKYSI